MKKAIIIILAIVIALALGGFGGYYYANNTKQEVKKEKPTSEVKTEVLETTDPIIESTLNKMEGLNCNTTRYSLLLEKNELKAADISNEAAINLIAQMTVGEKNSTKKYSEAELTGIIQKILGKDYKFTHKNYKDFGFEYNEKTKEYTVYVSPWGCTTGPHAEDLAKVTKAVVEGDTLTITYKVLFGQDDLPDEGPNEYYAKYYKDFGKKQQVPQKSIQFYPEPESNQYVEPSIDIYYAMPEDNNYNLGSTYQFTFEKQDGEYVFVNSKLMK